MFLKLLKLSKCIPPKDAKESSSEPPERKSLVLNFKGKEKINQKHKLGFTSYKLASDYGLNPHSVYLLTKDEERLANYRIYNP